MNTTPSPAIEAVELPELPEQLCHVHSDGEFCWDRQPGPVVFWPVELYDSDQMRAYARALLAAKQEELDKMREALTEIAEREMKQRHGLTDFGESWNKGLFISSLKEIARNALKRRAALSPIQGAAGK